MPSRSLVATVATFLVLLAGCAEKTGGSPGAGDQTTNQTGSTEQSSEETPTGESSPSAAGLADLQPCDLVDASQLGALQLTGGEEKDIGGARTCIWRREGATVNDSFSVSLGLWDEKGLGDLNAPQKQPTTIGSGSHEAVSFVDSIGTCGVGIAITDTSRVETSAIGGAQQQDQACQLAAQLATVVEPKLP